MASRKIKKSASINKVDNGYSGALDSGGSYGALNVGQLKKILRKFPNDRPLWMATNSSDFSVQHIAALGWVGEGSRFPFASEDAPMNVHLQSLSPSGIQANLKFMQECMLMALKTGNIGIHPLVNQYNNTLEHSKHEVLEEINKTLQQYEEQMAELRRQLKLHD